MLQPRKKKAMQKPKPYQIVGLQPAESMPIGFQNRIWDLASLSAEDADYLLGFPKQVPYIRPVAAATVVATEPQETN